MLTIKILMNYLSFSFQLVHISHAQSLRVYNAHNLLLHRSAVSATYNKNLITNVIKEDISDNKSDQNVH